ncbi:acetyl-CoA carboxylase carboxyl transferase subunit alpha [Caryophanon tenue]|uniref:Acetyl-coenzyme A carboxylase carboxyl transferase subunit alpha n=1 Tax=Caryophanon tenue TaxID=33978 RepID=A0A1C0YMH1_9BACL|nr:acetyl-CoA carboxylase carboxyl transferase subunit alpha [Caryophanon tenue]OCS88348.1 acetyl-CoA carboxylase carboxyltransferase subunit alpha [Caryophanon tenue]
MSQSKLLPFEQPLEQLRGKIEEVKRVSQAADLDMSDEVASLEQKLAQLEQSIYDDLPVWDRVQIARHAERPTTLDYISHICEEFIELHGDRSYADDAAIIGGIGTIDGVAYTIIGHQRGRNTKENIKRNFGMPHPEGYRKALRLMKQAEKFNRPILCLIDTKGAYPGKAAEERGQSEAIARNLVEMAGLTVPVVSIVIGEGGSGGALALGVANVVYMLENATYSVISPEGAASILWKDASLAQKAAEAMQITAPHLLKLAVIDEIIPEVLGGAHKDMTQQATILKGYVTDVFATLQQLSPDELVTHRYEKFKKIGHFLEE